MIFYHKLQIFKAITSKIINREGHYILVTNILILLLLQRTSISRKLIVKTFCRSLFIIFNFLL